MSPPPTAAVCQAQATIWDFCGGVKGGQRIGVQGSKAGYREEKDVCASGRHIGKLLYSIWSPILVCLLCPAIYGISSLSVDPLNPTIVKLWIQEMSWVHCLITRSRSSSRCHGNRPSSLSQELCPQEGEGTTQLWPFWSPTVNIKTARKEDSLPGTPSSSVQLSKLRVWLLQFSESTRIWMTTSDIPKSILWCGSIHSFYEYLLSFYVCQEL